jgi:urease accessory protein
MTARPARLALPALLALLAGASAAQAHPVIQGASGFTAGFLHPLLLPAHAFALVTLGLLIGQQPHWGRSVPLAALLSVVVGLGAIALAYVPTLAGEALLASAAINGAAVALARPLPQVLGATMAAATGLALALDSPPDAISLLEANIALLGTVAGVVVLLSAVVAISARLTRNWQRTGVRIVGAWIAASAILVLTLRLAR